jgi:hypothetical protein
MMCRNNFPNAVRAVVFVIPAQAENQFFVVFWFPACAGMNWLEIGKLFWIHSLVGHLHYVASFGLNSLLLHV